MNAPMVLGHLELTCIRDGVLHARIVPMEGRESRILGRLYVAKAMGDSFPTDRELTRWQVIALHIMDNVAVPYGPIQFLDEIPIWDCRAYGGKAWSLEELEYMLVTARLKAERCAWWPPVYEGEWT